MVKFKLFLYLDSSLASYIELRLDNIYQDTKTIKRDLKKLE